MVAFSCVHDPKTYPISGHYLVVGHPGGFVSTTVLKYYRINQGQIMMDATVPYAAVPDRLSLFHFTTAVNSTQYTAVLSLPDNIPAELLSKNGQHIGNAFPDMGYLDVRATINGTDYQWGFEGDQSGSSPAVQNFVSTARLLFR